MNIRPVLKEDASYIQTVARQSWNAAYGNIYPQSFIDEFVSKAYSVDSLEQGAERDEQRAERHFYVCEAEGSIIAFAQVMSQETAGEYELLRIYVQPERQNAGAGRLLLSNFLTTIPHMNKLVAWVEDKNEQGRRFYERNGFTVTSQMVEKHEHFETQLIEYTWRR
ncbi:GNAT family N-acetyltransferase [Paenibacillus assamensis]|uniref:GNAT family N-acetyltransferase n=1 Tax=Paenibacillus assamensis TaxID=311244 RepID=UPI0004044E9F|nr:GNAT family N-acetyltransferase [Paenibacillus assamensis]